MKGSPQATPSYSDGYHAPVLQTHQVEQIVGNHLQANDHLGFRQADTPQMFAAHLGQSCKGMLAEDPLLGDPVIAPLLGAADRLLRTALALNTRPVAGLLQFFFPLFRA